jgi:1-acyl-sn-glycerol-3-phosphate acyltransferase
MIEPSPEQIALLSRTERIALSIGEACARRTDIVSPINDHLMAAVITLLGRRRLRVSGLEHLAHLGPRDSILLVANHRSFFDFYIVSATLYWHTDLTRRHFFPVRATFFYDHPLGPIVNLVMSGMRMFPPIVREAQRSAWNMYSVARAVAELETPGTLLGIHPEGTRSKGDDPYAMLPAHSGAGKVALDAPHAHVMPVFVHGLTNRLETELARNWTKPKSENPIDVMFGREIALDDLREGRARVAVQKRAANRMREAILAIGAQHREERTPRRQDAKGEKWMQG